jgi:hypothetical protein
LTARPRGALAREPRAKRGGTRRIVTGRSLQIRSVSKSGDCFGLKNRTGRIETGAEHQSGQAEGCTGALQATEAGGGTRLIHRVLASGPPGVGARLLTATRQVRALRCQPIRRFRLLARTSGSQPEKTGSKPVSGSIAREDGRGPLDARITDAGYEPVNRNWS